ILKVAGWHRRYGDVSTLEISHRRRADHQYCRVHARQCGCALAWASLAWRLGLGSGVRVWNWLGLGLPLCLLSGPLLLRDALLRGSGLWLGARARVAQRALGVPARVALLVIKGPPGGTAFLTSTGFTAALFPLAHVNEVAGDCRGRGHCRRHKVGTALVTLPPLEISVRRRGAAFSGPELVRVHREAHRAAWLAPLESCRLENPVETLGFSLHFNEARAGYNHRVDIGVDRLALDHASHRTQVLDARIGA